MDDSVHTGKYILGLEYGIDERAGLGLVSDELLFFFREEQIPEIGAALGLSIWELHSI